MADSHLPIVVATDMDARAAGVFRYLGPVGHRFNHDHRDTSYFLAAGIGILFMAAGAVFAPTWLVEGLVLDNVLRLFAATAMLLPAYFTARWVMRHIDPSRTVAWRARTLYLEARSPRPDLHRRTAATAGTDLRPSGL